MNLNTIINSDCIEGMRSLPDGSVQCCVTSPPYWGLRDYGVDGQFGLEKTPDEYVQHMVEVFSEVRRVLRDDGTLWLNLGDSYGTGTVAARKQGTRGIGANTQDAQDSVPRCGGMAKQLIGIPWRVAFALQADGWYLRQDIVWAKPNPMPESVTDRCTKSHEYIFLLSKSARYYYDAEAIKEPVSPNTVFRMEQGDAPRYGGKKYSENPDAFMRTKSGNAYDYNGRRNKRDVWTVATQPFKAAHFATFPPDLITPCVLAGCPENGVVLDPFMGAGTTAVVAFQNNRQYIGFELNPDYCAIAEQRLQNTPAQQRLAVAVGYDPADEPGFED
jgi:DNA modification methylase